MKLTQKINLSGFLAIIIWICSFPHLALADTCTTYDHETSTLHVPSVQIGDAYLWIDLAFVDTQNLIFRLTDYGEAKGKSGQAVFDGETVKLNIPCIDLDAARTYGADLVLQENPDNIDLRVTDVWENRTALVVNEIMAKDADGGNDWIELFVTGDTPVNLAEYTLVDEDDDHEKAALPSVTLNPGEFYIIQATDEAPADGSAYVPFKLSSNDSVILYQGDSVADALDWKDGEADEGYTYGRYPDGTGVPQTLTPTPGAANVAAAVSTVTRKEGWEEASHGKSAEPDYDTVFTEGAVKRLDLTFSPEDWQAMLDDMTDLYGEFGSDGAMGPGGGGVAPQGFNPANPIGGQQPQGMAPAEGMNINAGGIVSFADVNPVWKPCTVEFEGKKWYCAGVRFKGNSSLKSSWGSGIMKLPFRFDFDKFEDEYPEVEDQRFYGFEKLSLASNYRDNSLIREKVVADIFRDAGVPAARTAFYRLYVDHGQGATYFGLYTMAEIPEKPMLEAQFMEDDGNLYKPEGTGAAFTIYDEASYDKETNEDEADYSDVKALFDALHADRQDSGLWRTGLETVFDADGFLRWLAVNTIIQNWDTYGNIAHNFYLYSDPGDGLIHWIPWDSNEALKDSGGMGTVFSLNLTAQEVGDNWPLIRYLMDDPVYRARYVDLVAENVETVFNPERMQPIYAEAHDLIRPYVVGDSGEETGYTFLANDAAFDSELDYLMTHVENRFSAAASFVRLNP